MAGKSKHWVAVVSNGETVYYLSVHVHPEWSAKVYPRRNGKYTFSVGRRVEQGEDKGAVFTWTKHDGWKNPALAKMAAMEHINEMEKADAIIKKTRTRHERN